MSPEIKQAFEEVLQDRRQGKQKPAPKALRDCRTVEDLCRYVFKIARLDGQYQMLTAGSVVTRWVWHGHTFTDHYVDIVDAAGPLLEDRDHLEELRLVATRVTGRGVERLRAVFPKAAVRVYGDSDCDNNWQLSQAKYAVKG